MKIPRNCGRIPGALRMGMTRAAGDGARDAIVIAGYEV